MRAFSFILGLTLLCAGSVAEENFLPADQLLPRVRQELAGKGEYSKRLVRRLGNRTIEIEIFAGLDGNYQLANQVFPNFSQYPQWALNDINRRSSGVPYGIQFSGLTWDGSKQTMDLAFEVNLPIYKHKGNRVYEMTRVTSENTLCLEVNAVITDHTLIKGSKARLYVWPATNEKDRLWLYFRGYAIFSNWLIYTALPERVVLTESAERIQTLMTNYQREENRVYALTTKKPVSQK